MLEDLIELGFAVTFSVYYWPTYTYCRGAVLFCSSASVIVVCRCL